MRCASIIVLLFVTSMLPAPGARAQSQIPSPLAEGRVNVIDLGLLVLSTQLFQMATAETLQGARQDGARFAPSRVNAYYLENVIYLDVFHMNAASDLSQEKADEICRNMINWVRFHLGLHDDGSPLTRFDDLRTSTLFGFVTPSNVDPIEFGRAWGEALDKLVTVRGRIGHVGGGRGEVASCTSPLVQIVSPQTRQ